MVNAYHRLVSLRMLLSSCISLEFVNYVLVYIILYWVFIHDEVVEFASDVFTVTHQLVAETAEWNRGRWLDERTTASVREV